MSNNFYEVNERGIVSHLPFYACGRIPSGEVVYAENEREAANLASDYRVGKTWLKDRLFVSGSQFAFSDVIHK